MFGISLMLLRVVASFYGGHRLRRPAEIPPDNNLLTVVDQVAARMGLGRVPIVAFCQRVPGPVVIGILRPVGFTKIRATKRKSAKNALRFSARRLA